MSPRHLHAFPNPGKQAHHHHHHGQNTNPIAVSFTCYPRVKKERRPTFVFGTNAGDHNRAYGTLLRLSKSYLQKDNKDKPYNIVKQCRLNSHQPSRANFTNPEESALILCSLSVSDLKVFTREPTPAHMIESTAAYVSLLALLHSFI